MEKIDHFFNNTAFDEMINKINELVEEVNKLQNKPKPKLGRPPVKVSN